MSADKITAHLCSVCSKVLDINSSHSPSTEHYGVCWEMGFSGPRGWGRRQNIGHDSLETVCPECFAIYRAAVEAFLDLMDSRRGVNAPNGPQPGTRPSFHVGKRGLLRMNP